MSFVEQWREDQWRFYLRMQSRQQVWPHWGQQWTWARFKYDSCVKRILAIFIWAINFSCVFQHTNSGLIEANGDKYDVSNKHIDKTIEHKVNENAHRECLLIPSLLNVLKHLSILEIFPRMKGVCFGCMSTDIRSPFKNDQVELLSLFTSAFEPHDGPSSRQLSCVRLHF